MVRRHLNRPHRAVFFAPITAIFSGALPFPGWCRERRDPTLAIRVLIRVMLMFRFSLSFLLQRRRRYPEGIAWNPRAGAFLVSSLRGGQLGLVYPDGRYRRFSTGKGLITTSGMLVDAERNRVLVCNEDVGSPSALRPVRAIAWRRCWSSISIPASCSRRTISHR